MDSEIKNLSHASNVFQTVESDSDSFKARVTSVVDMAIEIVAPLNEILSASHHHHHRPSTSSTSIEKNVICSS
jgi:hypothetical protein